MNERNKELQLIKDTITLYIDGIHNGDAEVLKKAFHPKAMMYGVNSKDTTIVEIEGLYAFVLQMNLHQKPASLINVL